MIAEVTNTFAGQWLALTVSGFGAIVALISIASFFATRTEVIDLKERVNKTEALIETLRQEGSRRGRELYRRTDRINGLLQRMAGKMNVHCEDYTSDDENPV